VSENVLCAPCYTKTRVFAKTGSGQTQGKLPKGGRLFRAGTRAEAAQRKQEARDDAWQRERERAVAVSHPAVATTVATDGAGPAAKPPRDEWDSSVYRGSSEAAAAAAADGTEQSQAELVAPAPAPPSFDDPAQWGLAEHHAGLRTASPNANGAASNNTVRKRRLFRTPSDRLLSKPNICQDRLGTDI
jgi:hypothetical protein